MVSSALRGENAPILIRTWGPAGPGRPWSPWKQTQFKFNMFILKIHDENQKYTRDIKERGSNFYMKKKLHNVTIIITLTPLGPAGPVTLDIMDPSAATIIPGSPFSPCVKTHKSQVDLKKTKQQHACNLINWLIRWNVSQICLISISIWESAHRQQLERGSLSKSTWKWIGWTFCPSRFKRWMHLSLKCLFPIGLLLWFKEELAATVSCFSCHKLKDGD